MKADQHKPYAYCIVGAGAAGLQLALALLDTGLINKDNRLLILDKSAKDQNDRTWCYWEAEAGRWDSIVSKTWTHGHFYSPSGDRVDMDLSPYTCKMIRGIDFYNYAREIMQPHPAIDWYREEVNAVNLTDVGTSIETTRQTYAAGHCFDSRVDQPYRDSDQYPSVMQHFRGRVVTFDQPLFDVDCFTMMDYRQHPEGRTGFMYILPLAGDMALLEYTYFDNRLEDSAHFDQQIEAYLQRHYSHAEWTYGHTEQGVIPMTTYPFYKAHRQHITKIGTAGGWVRPSSGYGWSWYGKHCRSITQNIRTGRNPNHGLEDSSVWLLDAIFLDILTRHNGLGPEIFSQLYRHTPAWLILKFMDGDATILETLRVMTAYRPWPFIRGMVNVLRGRRY